MNQKKSGVKYWTLKNGHVGQTYISCVAEVCLISNIIPLQRTLFPFKNQIFQVCLKYAVRSVSDDCIPMMDF